MVSECQSFITSDPKYINSRGLFYSVVEQGDAIGLPALDEGLLDWFVEFEDNHGRPPNKREVKKKALLLNQNELALEVNEKWIQSFCERNGLKLTHKCKQKNKNNETSSLQRFSDRIGGNYEKMKNLCSLLEDGNDTPEEASLSEFSPR